MTTESGRPEKPKRTRDITTLSGRALRKRLLKDAVEPPDPEELQAEAERQRAMREQVAREQAEYQERLRTNRDLIPRKGYGQPDHEWIRMQPTVNDGGDDLQSLPLELFRYLTGALWRPIDRALELMQEWAARSNPPRAWADVEAAIGPELAELRQQAAEAEQRRQEAEEKRHAEEQKKREERKRQEAKQRAERFGLRTGSEWESQARTEDTAERWLVEGLLVRGQPAILAGPAKTLKTSLALYLALGIASGRPVFGGKYGVPKKRPVLVLSAESGEEAIRATSKAICAMLGTSLAECDVHFGFRVPTIEGRKEGIENDELEALAELVAERKVELLVVDPAYMACVGIDSNSLSAMGSALQKLNRICSGAGCTLLIIHHARKGLTAGQVMQLDDLSGAGYGEFFRQWILVNKRKPYDARSRGEHSVIANVGGSAGHAAVLVLHVNEGLTQDEASRRWQVSCGTLEEAEQEDEAQAKPARRGPSRKVRKDAQKVLEAAQALLAGKGPDEGVEQASVRAKAELAGGGGAIRQAVAFLADQGSIVVQETKVGNITRKTLYLPGQRASVPEANLSQTSGAAGQSPRGQPVPDHEDKD